MADRDVVGLWFEAIASLGADTHIQYARLEAKGAAPAWFNLSHARFDGIGGFAELLRKHGHETLGTLPELKEGRAPRLFAVLGAWARYVFRLRPTYVFSAMPKAADASASSRAALRIFDEEETSLIAARAKTLGVTVNTLLLDRITRVVRKRLEHAPREIAWMIPVNLRGPIALERDTANHSSFLEIAVREGEPEIALQARVRDAVRRGDHWAFWYAFQFGRFFGSAGRRLFMRATIHGRPHWVGSFSNLGRWDLPASGETPWAWAFFPPPVASQPLGIGCVTYRGRLGIALQIHASLTTDTSMAEEWLADMGRELVAHPSN